MARNTKNRIETNSVKRLYRSENDQMLAGVCGGIAEYLDVDPTIVRLLWAIGTLASFGFGIILYIIAAIIIPKKSRIRD